MLLAASGAIDCAVAPGTCGKHSASSDKAQRATGRKRRQWAFPVQGSRCTISGQQPGAHPASKTPQALIDTGVCAISFSSTSTWHRQSTPRPAKGPVGGWAMGHPPATPTFWHGGHRAGALQHRAELHRPPLAHPGTPWRKSYQPPRQCKPAAQWRRRHRWAAPG